MKPLEVTIENKGPEAVVVRGTASASGRIVLDDESVHDADHLHADGVCLKNRFGPRCPAKLVLPQVVGSR